MASAKTHGFLFEKSDIDKSYALNTPAPQELGLMAFMSYANGVILDVGPITLTISNTQLKFENVYGFNRVFNKLIGDPDLVTKPRADVAVVSLINGKFKEVCYLTLDWVTSMSDVRYYSGLNFRADGGKLGNVSKDAEVTAFLRRVVQNLDKVVKEKKSFYSYVKDQKLAGRAAFGPLYKRESKKGKDNVDGRGEGKVIRLNQIGDTYSLKFSNGFRLNDRDLQTYLKDPKHRVVLSAEPSSTHRFKVDGKEYKGVRVLLKPAASLDSKAEEFSKST